MGEYHRVLRLYRSIRTTSPHIKAILYYNIANTYAKLEQYEKATRYYSRSLQIEYSDDALYNLGLVSLKRDRDLSLLSIAKPQSQSSSSTKESKKDEDESKSSDTQQSSGSIRGDKNSHKDQKEDHQKNKIILEPTTTQKQPLSSKVYELINKGYIYEKQPW
jgi:Ca-activated chloride channel family protein